MLIAKYNRRITSVLFLIILSLSAAMYINYLNLKQTNKETNELKEHLRQLSNLQQIVLDVQNIETGQRGYILTGNEKFLNTYFLGLNKIKNDTVDFVQHINFSEEKKFAGDSIMHLIRKKITHSLHLIQVFRKNGFDSAASIVKKQEGLKLMDEISIQAAEFERKHQEYLKVYSIRIDQLTKNRYYQLGIVSLLIILFITYNFIIIIRDFKSQKKYQDNLEHIKKQLEAEVEGKVNELKQATEKFMMISNATSEAIWDWDIASGKIWGNAAYLSLLNIHEGEYLNFSDFVQHVSEQDLNKIQLSFATAVQQKQKTYLTEFKFRKNPDTEYYFVNRSSIVYDEQGNPIRCLGGLIDLTEQNKIKEQIINEKEISDKLINSLPGVFYMFNKEGKYLRWNQNLLQVSGYTNEDMALAHPQDFVPVEQRAMIGEKIQNVFSSGIDYVEADFFTKDQQKIPFYFSARLIVINGEECLMGVGFDLTDKIAYQQKLIDLAAHLQNVREEEQKKISREIHDELGQQLTGIKMNLYMLQRQGSATDNIFQQKISDLIALTDETIQSIRRISTQLRPAILDDLGLLSALEWITEDFEKKYQIPTSFDFNVTELIIDSNTTTALFRIFQESLTNIIRHAAATAIHTSLIVEQQEIKISIEDNGQGFDIQELKKSDRLGITGMKERADMIGAIYEIRSELGKGTTVTIKKSLV